MPYLVMFVVVMLDKIIGYGLRSRGFSLTLTSFFAPLSFEIRKMWQNIYPSILGL